MKDRLKHTHDKKVNHRVKHVTMSVTFVSLFLSIFSIVLLSHYSKLNRELNRHIDNYEYQINYIEYQKENAASKFNINID